MIRTCINIEHLCLQLITQTAGAKRRFEATKRLSGPPDAYSMKSRSDIDSSDPATDSDISYSTS